MAVVPVIRQLERLGDAGLDELAELTLDVVAGGASVGFMHPLTRERARTFWQTVASGVASGERVLFLAEDERGVTGTVQLVLAQMENQPHRADVSKLMVHRRARKQGIGAALMRAAEEAARALGRTVLVLDTASADAERLYDRLGWRRVGVVPDYALWPDGGLCDTTVYYRKLER